MLLQFWEAIVSHLRQTPYWSKLQAPLTLVSLYLLATTLAYQYIAWRYGITPPLSLYLHSYVFKRISIVFLATVVAFVIFGFQWRQDAGEAGLKVRRAFEQIRLVLPKIVIFGVILALTVVLFLHFSPNPVSHIRIKFLDRTEDVDMYAFAYLIYEINKLQRNWYFEIDFDVFKPDSLTSRQRESCAADRNSQLCYAETLAAGKPLIGLTAKSLGEDSFWQNRGTVSVISTHGWKDFAPPSAYEFLSYSTVVQSIVIHLNAHCKGLPAGSFEEKSVAYGDIFQYSPRRTEMKAAILGGHLNPKGEELLFNCFGLDYMTKAAKLLELDWLRSRNVVQNLRKAFHVNDLGE
jgi:hypothetical protein